MFVDLLRFVAAFQMLQGHTVSALLAPAYRVGPWYAVWSAARGLTSVAFLFAAGLSFQIVTAREHALGLQTARAQRARIGRALRLIALGYLLHAPLALLWAQDPRDLQPALAHFCAVDILQCIGVTMIVLELLARRSPRRMAFASAALGVGLLLVTPVLEKTSLGALPRTLANYLTTRDGSLFPLVPWSAHVFLGVACGAWVNGEPLRAATRLATVAAGLFGCASVLRLSAGAGTATEHLVRLAWVVAASALLAAASVHVRRLWPVLQVLAAETLFLYVVHVLLVYGDGVGLANRIGPRLTPFDAAGAALTVIVGSFAAALGYRALRNALARKRLAG